MKRRISIALSTAAVCLLVVWTAGDAQVNRPKGQPINPYTGLPLAAPVANPFTGAAPATPSVNPLTGAPGQAGVQRHPFTGQPLPSAPGYNPLTAKQHAGLPPAGQTNAGT